MVAVMRGWNILVYKDGVAIGRAETVTLTIASGLTPYYELGNRHAVELVEGNEEVTGTLTKAWIDTNFLALVTDGLQSGGARLDIFDLWFVTQESGGPYVYAFSCKAENWNPDIPQDDFLMDNLDFRAKYVSYGSYS